MPAGVAPIWVHSLRKSAHPPSRHEPWTWMDAARDTGSRPVESGWEADAVSTPRRRTDDKDMNFGPGVVDLSRLKPDEEALVSASTRHVKEMRSFRQASPETMMDVLKRHPGLSASSWDPWASTNRPANSNTTPSPHYRRCWARTIRTWRVDSWRLSARWTGPGS